jgi:hypothetical protein
MVAFGSVPAPLFTHPLASIIAKASRHVSADEAGLKNPVPYWPRGGGFLPAERRGENTDTTRRTETRRGGNPPRTAAKAAEPLVSMRGADRWASMV